MRPLEAGDPPRSSEYLATAGTPLELSGVVDEQEGACSVRILSRPPSSGRPLLVERLAPDLGPSGPDLLLEPHLAQSAGSLRFAIVLQLYSCSGIHCKVNLEPVSFELVPQPLSGSCLLDAGFQKTAPSREKAVVHLESLFHTGPDEEKDHAAHIQARHEAEGASVQQRLRLV
jgi:hypothetical protein